MKHIGFACGYSLTLPVKKIVPWIVKAEELGFKIAFFSERLMTNRDAISAITAFALSTSRIKLGFTQMVRIRSPLVYAQTLASLDEISNGRIIVSFGACTNSHARRHGLEFVNPALSLKENTELVRSLLSQEKTTFRGKTISIEDVGLAFRPIRTQVPIWFAAISRTGLRLAGAIADGVLLDASCSPEYSRNAIAEVKRGAMGAGRTLENFEIAQLVVTAVSNDCLEAVDAARTEVASKFIPQELHNIASRRKVGEPCINEEILESFRKAYQAGGENGIAEAVPNELIENLTVVGSEGQVRSRIEEYRNAGVTLPILRPANDNFIEPVLNLASN